MIKSEKEKEEDKIFLMETRMEAARFKIVKESRESRRERRNRLRAPTKIQIYEEMYG